MRLLAIKPLQNLRLIIDTLTANTNLLYELPLEYESVVDKGNKYIVRFSTGYHYQWTERRICDISLWLYSVVDDDNINRLKDKETYYLSKAKFMGRVNDKIELPNGDTFDHKPHVALIESPLDTTIVGLGGLYVKDIELKEQKELLLTTGRGAAPTSSVSASRPCISTLIILLGAML